MGGNFGDIKKVIEQNKDPHPIEFIDEQRRREEDRQKHIADQPRLAREAERRRREEETRRRREEVLANISERESKISEDILSRTPEIDALIEQQLALGVEELGFQAGQARQVTGSQAAGRGLLRSSFTDELVGEVTQRELARQADLRGEASQRKLDVRLSTKKVLDDIAERRAQLAEQLRQADLESINRIDQEFSMSDLEATYKEQIMQMQLEAGSKQSALNSFASLLGTGITLGFLL